jgi:hypothetical protein
MVDLGLLGKSSENDHAVSTRFFEDQLECALKTTKELVQHLITVDTIIAYSPKADTVAIFAPQSQSDRIHDSVGYYSSKAKITVMEQGLDRHLLSLAMGEFLMQSLASSSPSSPTLRVKDLFVFAHYYHSTEAGSRDPAYSIQIATNTDYKNRVVLDLKIQPQSVSFRSLHVPSNYLIEEEEEPLRCVVLPSLRTALIKSWSDKVPEESSKNNWNDFVDFYERHHKIHLPDEVENKGYATLMINSSQDPNRFTNAFEEVVPVALLWSESGLSRRDLHGDNAQLLSRFVISRILSIESLSTESENKKLFSLLLPNALPDVVTVKIDEMIEKKKESRARAPGFIKSSLKSSQSEQSGESSLDHSFSTEPSQSQHSIGVTSLASQIDLEEPFKGCLDLDIAKETPPTLQDLLEALKASSRSLPSSKLSTTNRPVVFRSNVRLGTRITPGQKDSLVSHSFTPLTPQSTSVTTSGTQNSTNSTPNLKKRKIPAPTNHSSPQKAFQPPRPKIPKT